MKIFQMLIDLMDNVPHLSNKWMYLLVLVIIAFFVARILSWFFQTIIARFAYKSKTKIDDIIISHIKTPFTYILIIIASKLALNDFGFTEEILIKIIDSLMILAFFLLLIAILNILIDIWAYKFAKRTKSSIDNSIIPIFKRFSGIFFIILAIIFSLGIWGVDITPLIASAGIAGLAIGLAVKDPLSNIFNGISLILDKSINVGDKVEIDGVNGIIHDIGLRSTKIKTWENQLVIMPNTSIANAKISNYALPNSTQRITIPFSVAYGTDHKKVKKVVFKILKKSPDVILDPAPSVEFLSMGDFSLNFAAKYWVSDYSNGFDSKIETVGLIYDALNKNKINIPFPTSTIYLKKERN